MDRGRKNKKKSNLRKREIRMTGNSENNSNQGNSLQNNDLQANLDGANSPQSINTDNIERERQENSRGQTLNKLLFELYKFNKELLQQRAEDTKKNTESLLENNPLREVRLNRIKSIQEALKNIEKFPSSVESFSRNINEINVEMENFASTLRQLNENIEKTNYYQELNNEISRRESKEVSSRLATFFDGITLGYTNFRKIVDRDEITLQKEKELDDIIEKSAISSRQQSSGDQQTPVDTTPVSDETRDMAKRFIMRTSYEEGRIEDTVVQFMEKSDAFLRILNNTAESATESMSKEVKEIFKSLAAGVYEIGMGEEEYAKKLQFILKELESGEDVRIQQFLDEQKLTGKDREKFIKDVLNYEEHLVSRESTITELEEKKISVEEAQRMADDYNQRLRQAAGDSEKEEIIGEAKKMGFDIENSADEVVVNSGFAQTKEDLERLQEQARELTEALSVLTGEAREQKIQEIKNLEAFSVSEKGNLEQIVKPVIKEVVDNITDETLEWQRFMEISSEKDVIVKKIEKASQVEKARIERENPAKSKIPLKDQKYLSPQLQKNRELMNSKETILTDLQSGIKNSNERKIYKEKMQKLVVDPSVSAVEFQKRARKMRLSLQEGLFLGEDLRKSGIKGSLQNFKQGAIASAVSEAKYEAVSSRKEFVTQKAASITTSALTGGMLNKLLLLIPGIGPVLSVAWTVISKTFSGLLSVGKFLFSMVGKVFKVLGEVLSKMMELATSLLKGVVKYGTIALVAWVILFKTGLYKEIIPLISKVIKKVAPIVFDIMTKILKVVNESLEGLVKELNKMLSGGIYDIPRKIFDFFFGNNGVFGGDSGFSALSTELGKFGDNLIRVGSILLDAFVELGKAIGDFFMDIAWPLYIKPAFSSMRDSIGKWLEETEMGQFLKTYILDPFKDAINKIFDISSLLFDAILDIMNSVAFRAFLGADTEHALSEALGKRTASRLGIDTSGMSEEQIAELGRQTDQTQIRKVVKSKDSMDTMIRQISSFDESFKTEINRRNILEKDISLLEQKIDEERKSGGSDNLIKNLSVGLEFLKKQLDELKVDPYEILTEYLSNPANIQNYQTNIDRISRSRGDIDPFLDLIKAARPISEAMNISLGDAVKILLDASKSGDKRPLTQKIGDFMTQPAIEGGGNTEDYRNLAAQEIQADIGSKSSGMARELTEKLSGLPEDKKQPFIESVTKRGLFAYDNAAESFVAKEDAIPSLYKTETVEGGQEISLVDEEGKPIINTGELESYIHSLNTSFRTLMYDSFDPLADALEENTRATEENTKSLLPEIDNAGMGWFGGIVKAFLPNKGATGESIMGTDSAFGGIMGGESLFYPNDDLMTYNQRGIGMLTSGQEQITVINYNYLSNTQQNNANTTNNGSMALGDGISMPIFV